ncbi:MAG: c-type cytochrome [Rhodospirillales bacterium]|nr:c-type cytochrome [Rhodospirillales bacterium]MBO6788325.1 c-type cytochrome [Rhodospirillales bacterium]
MLSRLLSSIFCSVAVLLILTIAIPSPAAAGKLERGAYLAAIMDCTGCHTPGAMRGEPDMARYLGGSDTGFMMPGIGTFYPPNLTSDQETGLGRWSVEEIVDAIRSGVRPDGRALAPIMPFPSYAALTDEDAVALATYIKSLKPVSNKVPGPFGKDDAPTAPYLKPTMP